MDATNVCENGTKDFVGRPKAAHSVISLSQLLVKKEIKTK